MKILTPILKVAMNEVTGMEGYERLLRETEWGVPREPEELGGKHLATKKFGSYKNRRAVRCSYHFKTFYLISTLIMFSI